MAYFKDTNHLYKVLGGFFEFLSTQGSIANKLLASNLKLRFHYKQPDGCIFIDLSGDQAIVTPGDFDSKADVELFMKAEVAHEFWQGKVNLVTALARRAITAKGPIPKILKLLPIIKPAYDLYQPYLLEKGFEV